MTTWPILSVTTFLPLVGAIIVYLRSVDDDAAKCSSTLIALRSTLSNYAC